MNEFVLGNSLSSRHTPHGRAAKWWKKDHRFQATLLVPVFQQLFWPPFFCFKNSNFLSFCDFSFLQFCVWNGTHWWFVHVGPDQKKRNKTWKTLQKKAKKEQEKQRNVVFLRVRRGRTAQQPVSGKNTRREQRFSKSFASAGKSKFAVWKKSGKFEIFVAVLTRRTLIFLQGKCEQTIVRPVWGYILLIPPNGTDPFLFLLQARKRNFCLIFVPNKNGTKSFVPSRILGGAGVLRLLWSRWGVGTQNFP